MDERAYCDCHVNIWNDEHVLPLYHQQLSRVRQGAMAPKADADTLAAEMAHVERAIVFALRYGDAIGIESTDETTAAAVAKYPEKFVGFAYCDPRRADCMEMLEHGIEDLGLKKHEPDICFKGAPRLCHGPKLSEGSSKVFPLCAGRRSARPARLGPRESRPKVGFKRLNAALLAR